VGEKERFVAKRGEHCMTKLKKLKYYGGVCELRGSCPHENLPCDQCYEFRPKMRKSKYPRGIVYV